MNNSQKAIRKKELLNLLEKMQSRVDLLPEKERNFVRLFLAAENFRYIAQMAGVNEATIARRLKKIANRIASSDFVYALANPNLTHSQLNLLREHYVNNLSLLQISKKYCINYYKLRKFIGKSKNSLNEQC